MSVRSSALVFLLGFATLASAIYAQSQDNTLHGLLTIVDSKGRAIEVASGAVISFASAQESTPAPAGEYEIVTENKDFQPHVLPVPLGSTVAFPNQDPILHNVFSVSGENRFDLGLYRRGDEGKSQTFKHPGVVQVFCNVHHAMAAYVVVLETPHFAVPQDDGRFRLEGLPAGPGTLTVWHERAEAYTSEVILPLSDPLHVRLTATRDRVPKHRNKLGKPYSRRSRDY